MLVALLVCLIPTTIGGLLSAIGMAGMDRMMQANVIATSGRAVEAAGDVDVLLLDKTGTITLGNRQASDFLPAPRRQAEAELADAAQLASLADETPEGRSIVVLAKQKFSLRERDIARAGRALRALHRADAHERRRPGDGRADPQGRGRRHPQPCRGAGRQLPAGGADAASTTSPGAAARRWWWPTATQVLGVIELKDIVKGGIKERFAELRRMGIKTVMITGDNRADRRGHRRRGRASTTSSPRPRPRPSSS